MQPFLGSKLEQKIAKKFVFLERYGMCAASPSCSTIWKKIPMVFIGPPGKLLANEKKIAWMPLLLTHVLSQLHVQTCGRGPTCGSNVQREYRYHVQVHVCVHVSASHNSLLQQLPLKSHPVYTLLQRSFSESALQGPVYSCESCLTTTRTHSIHYLYNRVEKALIVLASATSIEL